MKNPILQYERHSLQERRIANAQDIQYDEDKGKAENLQAGGQIKLQALN